MNRLLSQYWLNDIKISKIADSLMISKDELYEDPYSLGEELGEELMLLIEEKANLLEKYKNLKSMQITTNKVVQLDQFRRLTQ